MVVIPTQASPIPTDGSSTASPPGRRETIDAASAVNGSLMLVDDETEWIDEPVNCGIVANPLPSGYGFYRGGPEASWYHGGNPAAGPRVVWDGHAYWTGATASWRDHDWNNWAIWSPMLPGDGLYRVEVFVPRMGTGDRYDTRSATYKIRKNDDPTWDHEVSINQLSNVGGWVSLGVHNFTNTDAPGGCGGGPTVMLTDVSSDVPSAITFDAMRWTEASAAAPVTVDAYLRDLPCGAHVPEGSTITHCFSVSRPARMRWWWYNPTAGWSLSREFDENGRGWCDTSDRLQGTGIRKTKIEVFEAGQVLASDECVFYVDAVVPRPESPSGFRGQAISPTAIELAWNDTANETSYYLDGEGARRELPADTTTHTVTGLTPDTEYAYRLHARNAAGEAMTDWISIRTPADVRPCPYLPGGTIRVGETALGGKVINAVTGQAVPGVELAITLSGATTPTAVVSSDAKGYYAVRSVGPGATYHIGAARFDNYYSRFSSFAPPVQQGACNTYDVPLIPKQKVAVLVHGWGGLSALRIGLATGSACAQGAVDYDPRSGDFGDLATILADSGYIVFAAHYDTGPERTDTIDNNARCLRAQVADVLSRVNAKPSVGQTVSQVTLLAHSMGGLVSRAFVESPKNPTSAVRQLITLGTPHLGIPDPVLEEQLMRYSKAWTCKLAISRKVLTCAVDCKKDPGSCQLRESFVKRFNDSHKMNRAKVGYELIGGSRSFPDAVSGFVPSPNDGVIPLNSSLAVGLDGVSGRHPVYEAHADKLGSAIVLPSYFTGPETSACLATILRGERCKANFASAAKGLEDGDSESPLSPSQGPDGLVLVGVNAVTVQAGGRSEIPRPLDGSAAVIAVRSRGGRIETTLRDPRGRAITRGSVGTIVPGGRFETVDLADGSLDQFILPSIVEGLWTVELREMAGADTEVLVSTRADSAIRLIVDVPAASEPGAMIEVSTRFNGGGSLVTTVSADSWVDGAPVVLADDGMGRFSGRLRVPSSPGLASVTVVAQGRTSDGRSVDRQASAVVEVRDRQVGFAGAPVLELVDANGNLRYDEARLTMPIRVDVEADYLVTSNLRARNGDAVAHAAFTEHWTVGNRQPRLSFDGRDVGTSGKDGPYTVDVEIVDAETAAVVLEGRPLIRTASLEAGDFEGGPPKRWRLYVPAVERWMP